jgi:group I intron endonuclease
VLVYKVTNRVNGKVYIGKTIRTLESRWKQHIYYANRGNRPPIAIAIRSYGPDAFDVSPLAFSNSLPELNDLEREYIQEFRSYDRKYGYNLTLGGDGASPGELNPMFGKTHTDEVKEKLRQFHLGKKHSEETKRKIGDSERGEKNGFYGRHHSENTKALLSVRCGVPNIGKKRSQKTKDKISEALKGRTCSPEHRLHISESKKGTPRKHHSEESRQKMSEIKKLWWNNRKLMKNKEL